jgi:predicted Zn-dependent peptidase
MQKTVFRNGLRLLTIPVKDVKTLSLFVVVGAGSNYEEKGVGGISHFLEHMMFKGTKKRPDTKHISEELDSMGADYNAFTGRETTAYYIKSASFHAERMFDILSDMLLHSTYEKKEIEKEKGVVLEELNMYNDMPMDRVAQLFDEASYGDQPAGRPIIGSKETIGAYSRAAVMDYKNSHYTSRNMLIVAAGDVSNALAKSLVDRYFSGIAEGQRNTKKHTTVVLQKPSFRIEKKETDQTHLIVGFHAFDMFSEKRFAAKILASVLGGNMSSRLFLDIREKKGLAYYVGTTLETLLDCGMFYTKAGVRNGKAEEATADILKEHQRIATKGITQKELAKSKDYLVSKMVLGLETSDDLAGFFGGQEMLRDELTQATEIAKKFRAVALADVKTVAKELFVPGRLVFSAVGPIDENKALRVINHF